MGHHVIGTLPGVVLHAEGTKADVDFNPATGHPSKVVDHAGHSMVELDARTGQPFAVTVVGSDGHYKHYGMDPVTRQPHSQPIVDMLTYPFVDRQPK